MKRFIVFSGLLGSVSVCLYPPIRDGWRTGRNFILTGEAPIDWNRLPLELLGIVFITAFLYLFHEEICNVTKAVFKIISVPFNILKNYDDKEAEKKSSSWGWGTFLLIYIAFTIIVSILRVYR